MKILDIFEEGIGILLLILQQNLAQLKHVVGAGAAQDYFVAAAVRLKQIIVNGLKVIVHVVGPEVHELSFDRPHLQESGNFISHFVNRGSFWLVWVLVRKGGLGKINGGIQQLFGWLRV